MICSYQTRAQFVKQMYDMHMFQLMPLPLTVSCFSEIQIGFTFLVPAHPGSPGQWATKWVCVSCVVVCTMCCHSGQIKIQNTNNHLRSLYQLTCVGWHTPLNNSSIGILMEQVLLLLLLLLLLRAFI